MIFAKFVNPQIESADSNCSAAANLKAAEKMDELMRIARGELDSSDKRVWVTVNQTATKSWSIEEIKQANKDPSKCLVIIENYVYDLGRWKQCHPGGELVIEHMRSRDATDEVIAFHPISVLKDRILHFCVGKLSEPQARSDVSLVFQALENKLHEIGYYETAYEKYGYECLKLAVFLCISLIFTLHLPQTTFNLSVGSFFLGAMWHQASFLGHDLGHNSVFHDFFWDNAVGTFLAVWLGGLSLGWWKSSHDVHHTITNHPEHDPDIQHIPFFAVSCRFFENLYSTYHKRSMVFDATSRFFVSLQHYLYYIVLCFGRFNLYVQSFNFIKTNKRFAFRRLEIAGYIFFITWYVYLLSLLPSWPQIVLYVLISHVTTMLLHVQITISHFAMDTLTKEENPAIEFESFAERSLRTTMDVDCPEWMDGLHGGLQYQAIHHIFPRMPRHRLRKLIPVITQFAQTFQLTYHHYGFVEGNLIVLKAMRDVALQVHPFFSKHGKS